MATTSFRYFVVPVLPTLFWLYEKRVSVTSWGLGAGWLLCLERSVTGPGPGSTVRILGPDRSAAESAVEWTSPPGTANGSRDAVLDRLLQSGTGRMAEKTRRGAMVDTVWWEVEEHHGRDACLVTARRGLEGVVPPRHAALPDWVGEEITADQLSALGLSEPPLAG